MEPRIRRVFFGIAALYLLSALVHTPTDPEALRGVPHLQLGPLALAPPRVLSGDSPHYLVAVNSLIEDGDFDLSNNYRQARGGDWDMGARFRTRRIDRHVDVDAEGREIGTHSPFFPLLIAPFALPFRGTAWVGPVCVLLTLGAGLTGLWVFARFSDRLGFDGDGRKVLLWLALATPLWCYSRDLWTEPFVTAIWLGLLCCRNLKGLAALAILGTLIKYPFAAVPAVMGALALRRGESRKGAVLLASCGGAVLMILGFVQYLFADVEHFSLFHSGVHGGFDWPLDGAVGMLAHPRDGLLLFFPYLAWGLWEFRKGGDRCLPALAFFLVHAAYQDWMGGTGFSARYLTPMMPALVWAAADARGFKGAAFRLALAYSFAWGVLGGFFPALVYDRSPWEVAAFVAARLGW